LPQAAHGALSLISQSGRRILVLKIYRSTQKKIHDPTKFASTVAIKKLAVALGLKTPLQQIKIGARTGVESCQRKA
jgi:hypothetical protein